MFLEQSKYDASISIILSKQKKSIAKCVNNKKFTIS